MVQTISPEFKRLHYIFAGVAFAIAFITYAMTMQPTVPFWDCGEFIASAGALEVSHPPGAPLWTLVGHVLTWLVPLADLGSRYNLLSATCGALSAMLLYLVTVKVIKLWRGFPANGTEAMIHFGGALIAAMSFTWSDTVWFNSNEFIVFSPGLLLIAIMIWLAMIWNERAEEPGNEKYLMLIAFLIGLSMGVHQMSMLAFFPVWGIVFYRHWHKVSFRPFLGMVTVGILVFAFIFKIVLTGLVHWAGNGLGFIPVAILVGLLYGIYYTSRQHQKMPEVRRGILNLLFWGGTMIVMGYSIYTFTMIRAYQNPPMNEGAPTTFSKLDEYISRSQYGTVTLDDELFHRRLPQESPAYKPETWNNYSSDFAFFWQYQTCDMYLRYLAWNFIGREGDYQGARPDIFKTWAIPFMLGLLGLYSHFKRDPKRAMVFLAAFLIMGLFTAWYQDQQDPQPRERDYFYVGSFWVFAMWIGIASTTIMEWVKERYEAREPSKFSLAIGSTFAVIIVFGPINQCVGLMGMVTGQPFSKSSKWAEYSRHHNYIPFEYAYNILQSCEPNAILFTYGDNDTFPLWCLQDVYAIRRDVRIVQLQLVTMMWNVRQLKIDNDWGAKAIKLTDFSDQLLKIQNDDEIYKQLDWNPKPVNIPISAESARWITGDSTVQATLFSWTPKFVMPSDQVVLDIVKNNITNRPILYSVTVPNDSRAGLNGYLQYEGLVARVMPFKQPPDDNGLGGSIQEARYSKSVFSVPSRPHPEPDPGMILHTYADPSANRSGIDDEYSETYRYEFMRLANWNVAHSELAEARRALDTMEARIPLAQVPLDYSFASFISDIADRSGDWPIMQKYAAAGAKHLQSLLQDPNTKESQNGFQAQYELSNLEMRAGEYGVSKKGFQTLFSQSKPEQQAFLRLKLEECDARNLESKKMYDSAYHLFSSIISSYGPSQNGSADLLDLQNHMALDSIQSKK